MRTLWTSAGVVLLLLLCPSGSQATEGPPIAIHLAGEPRGALPGEPYQGELLIEVWGEGMLSQFQMEGAGWSTLDLRAPALAEVSKNPQMRIPFTVIANDPQTPLIFTLDWDGQPIRKSFDLSVATAERALHGAMTADAVGIPSRPPAGWVDPHKSYGTDSFAAPPPEGESAGKDYSITVSGRFGCNRPNDGGGTTFMPADAFLVQIRDDYGIDSTEAETYTDSEGYFSKTFTWTRNRDPDLYVRFIARNSVCETEDPTWGDDHKWRTATWWDYGGTHLDIGTKWPADEFWHGAVQLQTVVTRAMRWADVRGYDCDNVHVEWPDDDTMYTRANRAIHITEGRTWVEGSACHEFGHHFLHEYGDPVPNAYCNDVCDPNPPWDCTHCNWCRESSHTAFNEGFPNYLGWAIPGSFASDYGLAAQYPKDFEVLETCEEDFLWDEPLVTEGFVAAVLQDIHDWNVDDDLRFPGWRDVLNMGEDEILRVTNLEDPYSVLDFLRRFKAEYPATKNGLWETAMNNGFDLDEAPPGVVTDLTSITHDRHEVSTVPNAIMLWDRPDDDASGVGGYSIVYSPGAPEMPDDNEELGDEFISVSPVLTPGTWYFNIRAIDRAGHWSPDYLSYGPIVIAEPEPVDLTFMVRHGWDYAVVPSDAASHTSSWAQLSPTLPGDANSTYFSIGGRNDGGRANLVDFQGEILIDDEGMLETTWGTIPAGTELLAVNEGPIQVDGGRHMLHYRLDSNHAIAEISETNNTWGRQFVWTPFELSPNLKAVHSGAPRWNAGWDDYSGGPLFFNCQGFRFSSIGYWNAVVVGSTWDTVDLNLGLHDPSTGSDDGFEGVRALSGRGAQCTSALLVNRNTMGVQDWDVGVRNLWGDDSRTYWVSHVTSDSRSVNTPFTVTMDQYEFLRLDEFWIGSSNLGSITVNVETDPPQPRVHVQWRDDEFTYGGLEDPEAETLTGEDGTALLQLDLADGGMHCLTIFRDAKDDYQEVELTVLVQKTPPDLLPFETAAWHSPFTPRPANDGTTTTVPLPDELPGNVLSTYYNIALLNQTAGDAEDLDVNLFLDGVPSVTLHYSNFLGLHSSRYNMPTPQTVRGGRHTLSFWIDADETVEELDDDNNIYGEQYIWTPLAMSPRATVRRDMPPTRTGGWDQVRSGEGLWYNCDGLRLLPPRNDWAGIAVMPGSASDVDVRFHGPSSGAKSGFAANSVFSGWEGSVIDFVLVHWSSPLRIPLDVGVLATQGDQQYFAQYREGRALSTAPGIRGPYSMPRDDLWHLYEMDFAVGSYSIELLSESLFLDWGISLHPADESVSSRSLVHDDAAAWLRLAGNNEMIQFVISEAGKYGLVVYKVGAKDLTRDGEYRLEIRNLGPTEVPETPAAPAVTALRKLYPNPFNARLTVAFDLARASQVEISIHNVAGALVRRLVSGALPAGRHEAVWDGRDDAGREVASGGYFARMAGDQKVQVQKAVLVK